MVFGWTIRCRRWYAPRYPVRSISLRPHFPFSRPSPPLTESITPDSWAGSRRYRGAYSARLSRRTPHEWPMRLGSSSAVCLGESSHRSQHHSGNRLSVSNAEHTLNQCASRLGQDPFIHSAFRANHYMSFVIRFSDFHTTQHNVKIIDWHSLFVWPEDGGSRRLRSITAGRHSRVGFVDRDVPYPSSPIRPYGHTYIKFYI